MSKKTKKTVKKQKALSKTKMGIKKFKIKAAKKLKAVLNFIKSAYRKVVSFIFSLPVAIAILASALLALAPVILIPYAYKLGSFSSPHPSSFTVMLTNMEGTGGGSGSIISTSPSESLILTNEHVCNGALKEGGKVSTFGGQTHLVTSFRVSEVHDLCLVRVASDLKNKVNISKKSPELYSKATITGHPSLMPNIITEGHFGGREIISFIVGFRKCTEKDLMTNPQFCIFFGGIPMYKHYEAQVVSALIMPGSSGSAVLNSLGEISGVVFAGKGRGLSYAYIVPVEAVINFIEKETKTNLNLNKSLSDLLEIMPMDKEKVKTVCNLTGTLDESIEKVCEQLNKEEKF